MPCGVGIIDDIADADFDAVYALTLADNPVKTTKSAATNLPGGWCLTADYGPCDDGSDPIVKSSAADPTTKVNLGSATTTAKAFVQVHLADAGAVKSTYGVPIAVTLSQSGLETGWGRAVVGNSYFGIKAQAGQPSVTTATHEYDADGNRVSIEAAFGSFPDFASSALAYGNFLRTQPRYAAAFQHTDNPEAFAVAVANAGYATSPTYGEKLVEIMRTEGLEQFDRV